MWGITSRLVAPAIGPKAFMTAAFVASRPAVVARVLPAITASNPAVRFYAGGPKTSPKKKTTTTAAKSGTAKKAASGTKKTGAAKPKKPALSAEEKAEKAKAQKAAKQAKEQEKKEKAKLRALQLKEREKIKKEKQKEKEKNQKLRLKEQEKRQKEKAKEKEKKAKQNAWMLTDADGKQVPLPRKPKKANTFGLYLKARFPAVSEELISQGADRRGIVGLVAKTLGNEWKGLSAAQRAEWQERADAENAKHKQAVDQWSKNLTEQDRQRLESWNKARKASGKHRVSVPQDPTKPRQPSTAYFLFTQNLRKTQPELAPAGPPFVKASADLWKKASEDEKRPYEEAARAAKSQYHADLEKWKLEQELRH